MSKIRRRSFLTGVAGGTTVTTGCLGFGSTESSPTDSSGPISFRIKNRTEEERTLTLRVRRPFGWTPTDSTSTATTPVTKREFSVAPGNEKSIEDVIKGSGRFLVTARLDYKNGEPYPSRSTGNFRFDTADATSSRIDIDIWRLEEYPEFDKSIPESFPPFYHVEVGFNK